jgi:thiol-disulfide isomerase/thioredoxin
MNELNTPPSPASAPTRRRLPPWVIILSVFVLFIGALLFRLVSHPAPLRLCDEPAPLGTLPLFTGYEGASAATDLDLVSTASGKQLDLSKYRGKGVVLNFWASWCKPCEEEAAALESAWQKYKDRGIVFVGVDHLDQEPAARRYLEKFKVSYPNGPDLRSQLANLYGVRGVPETFFINPAGQIVGCRREGPMDAAELDRRISQILP